MHFTLADTLKPLKPYLPSALVSSQALARVQDHARWLPAALTDRFYLEVRLGQADKAVDLSFDTSPAGYGILAGETPALAFPDARVQEPLWERIKDLYQAFSASETVLGQQASKILLEFDVGAVAPSLPSPGVFVGLKRTDFSGQARQDPALRVGRYASFSQDICQHLWKETLPAPVCENLHRCCVAVSEKAEVAYVGSMLPRPLRTVRLCIYPISGEAIYRYLCAIGWPGSEADARATYAPLLQKNHLATMLHIDVWDRVMPRIGVEFLFARIPQRHGDFEETDFLDRLVALQLCTEEKREALLAWPGSARVQFPHVFWPTVLQRRVNHVKVVLSPQGASAKAYLFSEVCFQQSDLVDVAACH